MVSLGVRCLSRRLHVGSWKPWAAARGPGGCTWPSLYVPGCHHAVTLPTGPHRTIGEDPPPGPEDGLGSKRRAGTWWGPCGTPCLPRSGFLCAKQPSVRLPSAAVLEICPQLSSPPRESQFLTGVSGSSVAGPCRPTVQVPVQLEDETDPVTVQSPVQGPRRTHSTVCAPCRGRIRAAA